MRLQLRLRRPRPPAGQKTERPGRAGAGRPGRTELGATPPPDTAIMRPDRSVAAPTSATVTPVATGIATVAIVIVGVGVPVS
ncbi:hypothetical protein Acidovoranil_02750 [Acidovorax sp. FG27]